VNILVIQTAFLGDAVLTLPLIQEIARRYPNSAIDVISTPVTQELFEASPFVHKVYPLDKNRKQKRILSTVFFANALHQNSYDVVFSPHRSFRSAVIVNKIKAPRSVGFSNAEWKGAYTEIVKYRRDFHEVQRNLSLLSGDYGESWRIRPIVKVKEESKKKVNEFLERTDYEKLAAVAPGAVWATKKYPEEYYRKVIHHLVQSGFTVLMIGGKEDEKYCEKFTDINPQKIINASGKFSVVESIELLSHCDFIVSNDSAPTHLGQAAGIKTLTIFVSTIPGFGFYPYLPGSAYLSYDELDCKPCGIHGKKKCPLGTLECGYALKPERVIEKLEEMNVFK
jgi:heptosyltransferase-2